MTDPEQPIEQPVPKCCRANDCWRFAVKDGYCGLHVQGYNDAIDDEIDSRRDERDE